MFIVLSEVPDPGQSREMNPAAKSPECQNNVEQPVMIEGII
jgi:hypothetical protein